VSILLTYSYANSHNDQNRLLSSFLDGMFEECGQFTTITDGWEQSYAYKNIDQFKNAYKTIKETVALPNWTGVPAEYIQHMKVGFGLMMDFNWRKTGWNTTDFSKNYFTPLAFENAVRSALSVSDKYVWIYTEEPRWWTNPTQKLPKEYIDALIKARIGA